MPDTRSGHPGAAGLSMQAALAGAALVMGIAGGPHCIAMCGVASAAVIRIVPLAPAGRGFVAAAVDAPAAFHLGRIASYAVAGAVAAASVDSLARISVQVAALRPLWLLMHVAVFGWGAMLALTGRQPAWARRLGGRLEARLRARADGGRAGVLVAGLLWVSLPCGLLYSALMLASLANGPLQGAALMALFALGSGLSLRLGPWLWQRWGRHAFARSDWGARLGGAVLAVVAAQAVSIDLVHRIEAWCR